MNRSKITRVNELEKEVLLSAKAEKVEMTLNTSSAMASGLLIQRLTELYENPVEATVRETVSNALDAVTETYSGNRPTIQIIAPTSLHPVLTIKDNGVGMSYDDLKEIYSKYGSSTKTDNLETIGAYGLGAKAPLAYGTEFTVTSVKNGEKTTIIVAREELTNYIKIVNSVQTDEPSGTTVSVPVNSRDVSKFTEYIDLYKTTPMDKDVDLIINGNKIENQQTMLTNELKIYENDKETVFGRIWVDMKKAIEILNISDYNIKNQIKFVIGGWAYSTPTGRSRYYHNSNRNATIYVELKPGIVGFNSSRDAILENDRYYDFEKLVIDYIFSNNFTQNIVDEINEMTIEDFKGIMSTLLYDYKRYIKLSDEGLAIKEMSLGSRTLSFETLTHKETGFNINQILNNVPKKQKATVVFKEEKDRHYKTSKNSLMEKDLSYYSQFSRDSITTINKFIESVMNEEDNGHNLNNLVINLASLIHRFQEKSQEMKMTFVTDIKDEEEVKQLKNGRKNLVQIRNGKKELDSYTSILIYTKHTKKEMEKMIEDIKVEELDIEISTADKIIQKIKDYRAENKVSNTHRRKQVNLSTGFYAQDLEDRKLSNINNVDEDHNNFVIVTRNCNISTAKMSMIHAWYCNENNLDANEAKMYISQGMHTLVDLKILKETFGENIYRDPDSDNAGISNMYYEEIHDKVAQKNAIRNGAVNTSEKAFMRLITGVFGNSPIVITNHFADTLETVEKISKLSQISIDTTSVKSKLTEIANFDTKIFGELYYSSDWELTEDALTHLAKLVNKEHLALAQNLLTLANGRSFSIRDEKVSKNYSRMSDMVPQTYIIEDAYNDVEHTEAYIKLVKNSVEGYMEFVKETINQLLLIKFQ